MPFPPPKQRLGSLGLLAIVLLLAWSGSGCQSHATAPPAPSPAGPARRIVSLAPNVTEILFALGAGPRVVGCTNRCNHPPEVASLARIGDVKLDFERIVSLGADLLVAESVTNAQDEARLRSLGQNVLRVDSSTIEGYYATLHALGEVTGTQAEAAHLAASLQRAVKELRAQTQGLSPQQRPRVLVEIQPRPLITVGPGTFIDEMVTLAGGSNVFGDLSQHYPQVDPEAVVVRDPELVVLTMAAAPQEFGLRPGFGRLTAVRNHGVHVIDPDLLVRPSPRLEQGLAILAGWMREARATR